MNPATSACCANAGPDYLGALVVAVAFGGVALWCALSLRRDARREALRMAKRRHPSSRRHGSRLSRRDRREWERIVEGLPELAGIAESEGNR